MLFFYLHHNYCIFFSNLKAWFLFLYGVKDKKTDFVMPSVFAYLCHTDQSNSACHLQYDSCCSPGTFRAFVRFWYSIFFFINFTHLRLRFMLQSLYFISIDAMQWTFPFYTITEVIFFVNSHIFVWFGCIEPLLITVTSKIRLLTGPSHGNSQQQNLLTSTILSFYTVSTQKHLHSS
jgi:hypothetical protein